MVGIDLFVGTYGAFMMGSVTAVFGGYPIMISGATNAMTQIKSFAALNAAVRPSRFFPPAVAKKG